MNTLKINKSADLYNMILGALIALSSEQQVGKLARKASSENIFLGKWLKRVKNKKCYPKSVADDIDNLLQLYSKEGVTGNLASLFRIKFRQFQCINKMPQQFSQKEKQRFDNAISDLDKDNWFISLPIVHCKDTDAPYRPVRKKEVFTTKWYLDGTFNKQNNITKCFSIFVVSDPQDVIDCFYKHGFFLVKGLSSHDDEGNDYYQYQIFPNNQYHGNLAMPSDCQRS